MIFTYDNLINSIAGVLATIKDVPVYDSPSYNNDFPCFYVFLVNPKIDEQISDVHYRETMIDIVYVQERNSAAQNVELHEILEGLDENFNMIPYQDFSDENSEPVLLHTYERNASIEDQELHYKFTIKQRVMVDKKHIYMNDLEENNVEVKE